MIEILYVFNHTTSYVKAITEKLFPKLTLGPFLTLSVRNGPNLQSLLFQAFISLNPSRVEQNYTLHLKEMAKTNY